MGPKLYDCIFESNVVDDLYPITSDSIDVKYKLNDFKNNLLNLLKIDLCNIPLKIKLKLNKSLIDIKQGIPIKWNVVSDDNENENDNYYIPPIDNYTLYYTKLKINDENENNESENELSDSSDSDSSSETEDESEDDVEEDEDVESDNNNNSNNLNSWGSSSGS